MTLFTTFYLSRVIDKKVIDLNGKYVGRVKDILIDSDITKSLLGRPLANGVKIKSGKTINFYTFDSIRITKTDGKIQITSDKLIPLSENNIANDIYLADYILDKQVVDLNGRKLVRVNDIRLVTIPNGTFAVAVDIGVEGLLRRIGIAKQFKSFLGFFGGKLPAKFILWEDVEAVDFSNLNIRLSKSQSKLQTLHPSDLADIIEELGRKASAEVFSALDEEKAADVLEELDPETQILMIESLSIERAADVLDKMPADEVADILDGLEKDKAELLLNEMEKDTSQEVRELLIYPVNTVGSIMSTEILTFDKDLTIQDVLNELRDKKPEAETLYNLFVTDSNEVLKATFSLRDIVTSDPSTPISEIMKPSPVHLFDYQKIDEIAEFISKYNMLAIPVVDKNKMLQGMVVIDDVIEDLINKRRTNK